MIICRKYRGPRWRSHSVHAPSRRKLRDIARHPHHQTDLSPAIDTIQATNDMFAELPWSDEVKHA